MKCDVCAKETRINWGNASATLCEDCSEGYGSSSTVASQAKLILQRLGDSDEVYILRGSDQDGPYSATQVAQMWRNGKIKMNDKVWHESIPDWVLAADVLPSFSNIANSSSAKHLQAVGSVLVVLGCIITFYFLQIFDPSVSTNRTSYLAPDRVNNIGLLQTRQNGVIVGVALSVIGSMFVGLGYLRK